MEQRPSLLLTAIIALLIPLSGCLSGDEEEKISFPDFSAQADDGVTYNLDDFIGSPFIVLFSAEWCDAPCHSTMHALNESLSGPTIVVMSTDPQENPQGITLQDWHEKADAHDDDGDDLGQTLDFPFMKGIEAAQELDISARPTVVFVTANGEVSDIHKGGLTDSAEILDYWSAAGGTV